MGPRVVRIGGFFVILTANSLGRRHSCSFLFAKFGAITTTGIERKVEDAMDMYLYVGYSYVTTSFEIGSHFDLSEAMPTLPTTLERLDLRDHRFAI